MRFNNSELTKTFLCSSWTISSQICCYSCILITLTIILSFASSVFLFNTSYDLFISYYPRILEHQGISQINRFVKLQQLLTETYFEDKMRKLEKMNQIFQFVQQPDFEIVQPFRCFEEVKLLRNPNLTTSAYCCGFTNISAPILDDSGILLNFTSLMTEIYLMYNFRQPYFTSVSDASFFAIIDFVVKPSTTKVVPFHLRRWYLDHLEQMGNGNLVQQSSPFFSGDQIVSFALSTNLSHLNGSLLGIGLQNQDLRLIPSFSKNNIQFQMVNKDDQLIISPLYQFNSTEIYYIYNESLTGISKEEWEQMKKYIKINQIIQLNTSESVKNQFLTSRILSAMQLDNPESYILLNIDNSEDFKQQVSILEDIDSESIYIFNMLLIFCASLIILILVIQLGSINLLKRDISNIMKTTELKIFQHYFQLTSQQLAIKSSKTAIRLYNAYLKLINITTTKRHSQCSTIESIPYPQDYLEYEWNQALSPDTKNILILINQKLEDRQNDLLYCQNYVPFIKICFQIRRTRKSYISSVIEEQF